MPNPVKGGRLQASSAPVPSARERTIGIFTYVLLGMLIGGCGSEVPHEPDADIDAARDAIDTLDSMADAPQPTEPLGRVLILDQAFRPLTSWTRVIAAFDAMEIEAEYRRYYPHLTADDIQADSGGELRYDMVIMAAGYAPFQPHDELRLTEVPLAVEYTRSGGLLILATASALTDNESAANDWFVQNRVLERLEVGIRVDRGILLGDIYSGEPAPPHVEGQEGYPTALEASIGYPFARPTPFHPTAERIVQVPMGSAGPLVVHEPRGQVLLRSHPLVFHWRDARMEETSLQLLEAPAPVAAIAPSGEGFVAVLPRSVLTISALTGQLSDKPALDTTYALTSDRYLQGLVRWLWEVIEVRSLGELLDTGARDPLFRTAAPELPPLEGEDEVRLIPWEISQRPVPESPPVGQLYATLPTPDDSPSPRAAWMSDDRARVGYAGLPAGDMQLDTLFSEAASLGLDALMVTMEPERLLDSSNTEEEQARLLARFAEADTAADGGDAVWFMGSFLNGYRALLPRTSVASVVGVHGQHFSAPAMLDDTLWTSYLHPLCRQVGELGAAHPRLQGWHIDLELYGGPIQHQDGFAFSETSVEAFLSNWAGEDLDELRGVARDERYHWLVERGRLADYLSNLEDQVAVLATRCREFIESSGRQLDIMIYTATLPDSWVYRGLIRGLGTSERPLTSLSYETWSTFAQETLRDEGLHFNHLGGTLLPYWRPADLRRALAAIAEATDGYWFLSLNDISETNASPPALHGAAESYRSAIRNANEDLSGL